jgi:putative selenium metabolism hydrolase
LHAEQEQGELLALAQRLIRIPSLTSQEGAMAEAVMGVMRDLRYHEIEMDEWGNVVGTVRGRGSGSVLFDAHMDTVPWNPAAWQYDPLGGEVSGGRLRGRGASDMKGALAAALYGIGRLAREPGDMGTVHVCCSVCEEPAEGPMLVQVCERFRPDAVVIQEATELRINVGQRGRAELVVETVGKPAHSSRPDLGVNAVKGMARLLTAVEELSLGTDALLGPAILEVTDVKSSPYPGLSVVPDRCRATFDRRLLTGESPGAVAGQVAELAARLGVEAEVRVAETEVETYTGRRFVHKAFAPAWKTPVESRLVQGAVAALLSAGQAAQLGHYNFCTNGSGSAGILGIPTIGYGPGREEEAHIGDEFLELEQLYAAADGYAALARSLSR